MRATKAIRAIVEAGPSVFASRPLNRDRCILATSCGIAALQAVGVEAEALSVRYEIANAAFRAWALEGFPGGGAEGKRRGAWILETDTNRLPEPLALSSVDGDKWRGHVVIYVPSAHYLVDLDFQQLARPAKGIVVPPASALAWPGPHGVASFEVGGGVILRVASVPADRSFEATPDWTPNPGIVADLVRAVRRWRGPKRA